MDETRSLFAEAEEENRELAQPLAARMRPRRLAEFIGQQHILGTGKLLRRMICLLYTSDAADDLQPV